MYRSCLLFFTAVILLTTLACRGNTTTPVNQAPDTGNFRIGIYADLSGPGSAQGQSISKAASIACDEINRNGGINGRQVEVLVEDDRGQPAQATAAVAKMIQSKVHAIIGQSVAAGEAATTRAVKIPLLTLAGKSAATQPGDYYFQLAAASSSQGADMGKYAAGNLSAKRAAILSNQSSSESNELAQAFAESFTKLGGQITAQQRFTFTEKGFDYGEQLKGIAAGEPDVIYIPADAESAGAIARAAKDLKIRAVLLGIDGWNNAKLWDLGGAAVDGSYITGAYSADDPTQANRDFTSAFKQNSGQPPNQTAALAYDAVKLLADALKRSGTAEGAKLRAAIAETAKFSGLTGVITIDSQGSASRPMMIFKLQDGKIYPVYRSEG